MAVWIIIFMLPNFVIRDNKEYLTKESTGLDFISNRAGLPKFLSIIEKCSLIRHKLPTVRVS